MRLLWRLAHASSLEASSWPAIKAPCLLLQPASLSISASKGDFPHSLTVECSQKTKRTENQKYISDPIFKRTSVSVLNKQRKEENQFGT